MNSEKVKEIKESLQQEYPAVKFLDGCIAVIVSPDLLKDCLSLINEFESENEKLKQHKRELQGGQQDLTRRIAELEEYIKGNEQDAKAFVNGWHKDLETELKQFAKTLKAKMPCEEIFKGIWDKIDETLEECINEKNKIIFNK